MQRKSNDDYTLTVTGDTTTATTGYTMLSTGLRTSMGDNRPVQVT